MFLVLGTRRILFCAITAAALLGCGSERSAAGGDGRTAVTKEAVSAPGMGTGGGMAGGSPGGAGSGAGGFLATTTTSMAGGGMAGSGMAGSFAGAGGVMGPGGAGAGGDMGAGGLMGGGAGGIGGDTGSGTGTDSWTYTGTDDDAIVCESTDGEVPPEDWQFVSAGGPPLNGNGNEVITAAQCRVACAQAGQGVGVCRELCRGLKKAGCRGLLAWCDHLLRHRQKQAAEACYATHIALGCPGRN